MLSILRKSLTVFSLFLLAVPGLSLSAQDGDASIAEVMKEWNGTLYKWPKSALPAMTMATRTIVAEKGTGSFTEYVISGNGIELCCSNISPFYVNGAIAKKEFWKNSFVLRSAASGSAVVCFTVFDRDDFLPEVDEAHLMGYAKSIALGDDPCNGVHIEIVELPTSLGRKGYIINSKPMFLTWRVVNSIAMQDVQCTEYFFPMKEGKLLVVSIQDDTINQPTLRERALLMLKRCSFGSGSIGFDYGGSDEPKESKAQ